jgi:RNA recognition motif-containing protein
MDVKLYVGNLAFTTTVDDLRILFAQAGTIASIDLIKDRDTGESKGFAFVTMASQSDAQKAIGMFNDFTMQNREMKVNTAKAREERGGPGGAGGYQSKLGAFGPRGNPHKHRPRGGNRRY